MAGAPIKRMRRERANKIMEQPDFWEQLWLHLAEGNTLKSFTGNGEDVPYGMLFERIHKVPELAEKYEMIRNARALANAERIEALAEKVETEKIDPNSAKVAIGARQWLAERMDSKRWGTRQNIDLKVTDTTALHLEAVRNLMKTVSVVEPEKLTRDTATPSDADARASTESE